MTVRASRPFEKAIRLRAWVDYYADRWHVDAASLTNRTYGSDFLPMPSELRRRVSLLHEIAASLDRLFALGEQGVYWHCPPDGSGTPPAVRLETEKGCLVAIREDLAELADLVAVEEGRYQLGAQALASLLSDIHQDRADSGSGVSTPLDASAVKGASNALWVNWPDSLAVGRLLGACVGQPQRVPGRLRDKGRLLAVRAPVEQRMRFPPCQFRGQVVLPVMEELLGALPEGSGSGWIKAFWLYSSNRALGGKMPADLLVDEPQAVLAAARTLQQPRAYFGW